MTGDGATGGCLCRGVRFRVTGPLRAIIACHCLQCRKTSGHHVAASAAARSDIAFEADATLTWFESSPQARRGFCRVCGSNLFWSAAGAPTLSIFAGALDGPTGLKVAGHIFTAFKGDYYDLPADAPQAPGDATLQDLR